MITTFKSIIRRYNKRGNGFIYLPKEYQNQFKVGQQVQVSINLFDNCVVFFTRLRKTHKVGVYVPMEIANNNNLLNRIAAITIKEVEGFFTKLSSDGRIYLPQQKAQELNLKQNEIILIDGTVNDANSTKLCQVKIRQKQTTEYSCTFSRKLGNKEGLFSIKSIVSRNKHETQNVIYKIIKDLNYATLGKNTIIAFYGNRVPLLINSKVDLKGIAYYLGCYFADGTKKGNSWGICASTAEQAKYYLSMHEALINDAPLKFELTSTVQTFSSSSAFSPFFSHKSSSNFVI